MKDIRLILMVEKAAEQRGDPWVPRDYIVEAIERIKDGKEKVKRFPSDSPPLKDIFDIALKLYYKDTGKSLGR